MFDLASLPYLEWLGPAAGGFLAGVLLVRLVSAGSGGRYRGGARGDLEHRLRSVEAELRVTQRTAEQAVADRASQAEEVMATRAEIVALTERLEKREQRIRQLKADLQTECAKTDQLRRELCDRAEEMVRTHVQLRDTENELGVARVGSDVVLEQIARLERERDELSGLVEALRRERRELDPAWPRRTGMLDC